jgi:hypothetical protein
MVQVVRETLGDLTPAIRTRQPVAATPIVPFAVLSSSASAFLSHQPTKAPVRPFKGSGCQPWSAPNTALATGDKMRLLSPVFIFPVLLGLQSSKSWRKPWRNSDQVSLGRKQRNCVCRATNAGWGHSLSGERTASPKIHALELNLVRVGEEARENRTR